MDTWIIRMVGSRSAHRVYAWGAALVCILAIGSTQLRYITNFLAGPYSLEATDLDAIKDVNQAPRYFVQVTGSKAIDTGIQEISTETRNGVETSRKISAAYYGLMIGDRFLVCKGSAGFATTVIGELKPMPADLAGQLFSTPEMQELRDGFYPYYLDDEPFRNSGYFAIAGLAIFAVIFVVSAFPAWKYMRDPASHPLVARVATWGDPLGLAVAAERECLSSSHYGGGGWFVTDSFLIRKTAFSFDILRLTDLLWAYKKVTKHRVNFIPTGKSYEAILICYGGSASITGSQKVIDEILTFAAQQIPWAVFGFSDEIEAFFKKNQTDFSGAVEQRRQQWLQQKQGVAG
jgi:Family of unknown function (DUF6709)